MSQRPQNPVGDKGDSLIDEIKLGVGDAPVKKYRSNRAVKELRKLLSGEVGAKLTVGLTQLDYLANDGIPVAFAVGDDLGGARLQRLVGVENLEVGVADGIPDVAHLGAGEGQQTLGAGSVAMKIARGVLAVVVVDIPELGDDDVTLGREVGIEATLGDAGITRDRLYGDRVKAALVKETERALENR